MLLKGSEKNRQRQIFQCPRLMGRLLLVDQIAPRGFPNCLWEFLAEFSWTAIKQESHWQHTKEACSSYRQYSCFPPSLVNAEISEF